MNDLNKLRALSGIPLDLSKVENAKKTVRVPARIAEQLNEFAKVPSHRGELSPKTKKNMRDRASNAKKALEMLEQAKECLMTIPAVDYDDTIPKLIKQLHHMMHGEDGTGGVHHEHRKYQKEFDDMEFPEDLENKDPGKDGNPTEKEIAAKEKESAEKKAKSEGKKKSVKEGAQAIDQEEQQASGIADDMDGEGADSQEEEEFGMPVVKGSSGRRSFMRSGHGDDAVKPEAKAAMKDAKKPAANNPFEQEESSEEDEQNTHKPKWLVSAEKSAENRAAYVKKVRFEQEEDSEDDEEGSHKPSWLVNAEKRAENRSNDGDEEDCATDLSMDTMEAVKDKKPKWLEKKEVKAEEKAGKKVKPSEKKKVNEATGKLIFNPNASMNKMFTRAETLDKQFAADAEMTEPNMTGISNDEGTPTNVRTSKQPSLYYPPSATHDEGPNQMMTNPYNESQKVTVPAKIKSQLKEQMDLARSEAGKYEIRKDWDNKNFYENMANAFEVLNEKLTTGTIYSIKEAQIFMTSLMSLYTNKIPPDVVKFIAGGGSVRPLKDYLTKVSGDHSEV